jgi:hypothetical protein
LQQDNGAPQSETPAPGQERALASRCPVNVRIAEIGRIIASRVDRSANPWSGSGVR